MTDYPDKAENTPGNLKDPRLAQLPPLLVAVTAPASDGAATAAAERALAKALGVRPRQVAVVRGFTSREKMVQISDPDPQLPQRWRALLGLAGPSGDQA